MREVWFWQRIVTPHVAGLACALAAAGCRVIYVAERDMSSDRVRLGWTMPAMNGVEVLYMRDVFDVRRHVSFAAEDSVHICQGIRSNGLVAAAQRVLGERGIQQWVVMETVNDSGPFGLIKRFWYALLFRKYRNQLTGVLAAGHKTPAWVVARGVPAARVLPFAYFLDDRPLAQSACGNVGPFRFLFVGQLVERKRLSFLINSLAIVSAEGVDLELSIVGSGPLENELRALAVRVLPRCVRWVGTLPAALVRHEMDAADCLVLPSRHDGWGAVISEALMAGTPVICSDSCGAAGIVRASGFGGVFPRDESDELLRLLRHSIIQGRLSADARTALARWASSLGARAGAKYLIDILGDGDASESRPSAPWIGK